MLLNYGKMLKSVLFTIFVSSFPTNTNALIYATDVYPPYVMQDENTGNLSGIYIDLVQEIIKDSDIELDIRTCFFTRCLSLLREGESDMYVGLLKSEERQRYLSYIEPAFSSEIEVFRFYTNKKSQVKIDTYQDLAALKIGVLKDANYFPQFNSDNTLKKYFVRDTSHALSMLAQRRLDTVIAHERNFSYLLSSHTLRDSFEKQKYTEEFIHNGYVVFSQKLKLKPMENLFSKKLQRLIDDKFVESLFRKYEVNK